MNRLNDLDEEIVNMLPGVIATLCYIVVVSTPNFDSAFRIFFTVLNDRGLDLMPSDILKARVIGDIPKNEHDQYTNKWEEVEISLGRDKFNRLFEHIRMILQKNVKEMPILKTNIMKFFSEINGKRFIDEILLPYSELYLKLANYRSYYSGNPQLIKNTKSIKLDR
ncbi:hypothetical protein GCM10020331_073770 [Ectobacillus funiculus]